MNDELYDSLWWWGNNRPIKDAPYVFVSTSYRYHGQPFTTRRRFMASLCQRAGVKPFGFQALRRYVASVLADTHKVSAKTIQRILRHKNVTTTERYMRNINQDLHAVVNLLSNKRPPNGPHGGPHGPGPPIGVKISSRLIRIYDKARLMKKQEMFLDDRWSEVLSVLPRDLEESARTCGALERLRKVPSAANLLRMMLAYALSDFSLKDITALARADGIADQSGQAFHYRLTNGEKWLEHLLGQLLLQPLPESPTDALPLRGVDATVITGPGSKGTDWVAHMVMDPVAGQFTSVEITDARGAETFMRHTVNPGEVVLGDRMYATARGIEFVVNRGGYPVVRVNRRTLKVCDTNKKRIHLESFGDLVAEKGIISLDVLIPTPPDMTGKKSKAWDLKDATSWIPARIVGGANSERRRMGAYHVESDAAL